MRTLESIPAPAGSMRRTPLTPTQQAMLLQSLGGVRGVEQAVCEIREEIVPECLRRAWNRILARHEGFRAGLEPAVNPESGRARMQYPARVEMRWAEMDVQSTPETCRAGRLEQFLREDRAHGFELDHAPLMRVTLLRWAPNVWTMVWTIHHLVVDGASTQFLGELGEAYPLLREGRSSPEPEPAPSFADYADWMAARSFDPDFAHWQAVLGGFEEVPRPVLEPSPHRIDPLDEGRIVSLLSREESANLVQQSKRWRVSPATFVHAAWALLLMRYTGAQDVLFGVVREGRFVPLPAIHQMAGCFIEMVPFRARIDLEETVSQWLRTLQAQWRTTREYRALPPGQLEQLAHLPPGTSASMTYALAHRGDLNCLLRRAGRDRPGWSYRVLRQPESTWGVAVSLAAPIELELFYPAGRIEPARAAQVHRHLRRLLLTLCNEPDRRVGEIEMLDADEVRQLISEPSPASSAPPGAALLHRSFEHQSAASPLAVALVAGSRQFSYHDLDVLSARVAGRLAARGVKPGTTVALCLEREPELILAMLGILRAGGAYVPLDPEYPGQRLAWMTADSGCPWFITRAASAARPLDIPAQILTIEDLLLPNGPAATPLEPVESDLAYLIYTSGTTGTPKGVMIEHRSVANYVRAASLFFGLRPGDRVLQFASPSFDASVEEIFPCLSAGATLVLRPPSLLASFASFLRGIEQLDITVLDLPTAFWHELVAHLGGTADSLPPSVRLVIIGGEAARSDAVREWHRRVSPHVRLVNTYGPTEATVVALWCDLKPSSAAIHPDPAPVSIGQPVPGTAALLLDSRRRLVPSGAPGELFLGGAGLARGYRGRPELDRERFIDWSLPNIGVPAAPIRLYATGDRARRRPDGELEFLGRTDSQIKLRGFRIEPEEIENLLRRHPGVADVAVVLQHREGGTGQLVACLVPSAAGPDSEAAAALDEARIHEWRTIFDDLYRKAAPQEAVSFHILGWDSSYTHQPMPADEVAAWLDQTVSRIRALRPRRILELGCGGSGLLAFRLAAECETYLATDPSANAIRVLTGQLEHAGFAPPGLRLEQRSAHELDGLPHQSFDAVLIVSVAQYFPNARYLRDVLVRAADLLRPGGFIFLGDVRNHDLLRTFHTSVQFHLAPDGLEMGDLASRVDQQCRQERQLTVAPGFFRDLARQMFTPASSSWAATRCSRSRSPRESNGISGWNCRSALSSNPRPSPNWPGC